MFFEENIKTEALRLGFDFAGITGCTIPVDHLNQYRAWVARGHHAGMEYLETSQAIDRRADMNCILPGAKSVISLGIHYSPPTPMRGNPSEYAGIISAYAAGVDYHESMGKKLRELAAVLTLRFESKKFMWYVDTGAILERAYGQQAGFGWIGKNSNLITRTHGSLFFIGEILTDLDLTPDPPTTNEHCGRCRKCLDACPTRCINPDRTIDSRRCISYLTIENKGLIPYELRPAIGKNIFGCDICQTVCPWNHKVINALPANPQPPFNNTPDLRKEILLSEDRFNMVYSTSPVNRARRQGYLRNVSTAIGNMHNPEFFPLLERRLSAEESPLVRGHLIWALGQTPHPFVKRTLVKTRGIETDPYVLGEIDHVIINF